MDRKSMTTLASPSSDKPTRAATTVRAVTVFLSSAKRVDAAYFEAARQLGRAIAAEQWSLVYGGNYIGCMAALADGAREMGGHVVGVTPQLFVDSNVADTLCDELVVTDSMRQRKHLLEQRGDAFIALPGGLGTFEEFFEIVVSRQLGYHHKPIVLLNINDFYTPLLQMMDRGVEEHFIRSEARRIIDVATTVEGAIALLKHAR
jgi:uncharacterized protein (TIGR00730 family)